MTRALRTRRIAVFTATQVALPVAAALLLVACGGGGGGDSPAPPPAPAPVLSLFAGDDGGPGNIDGTGAAARFVNPAGIAFDAAGAMVVADRDNYTIRKVSPTGAVTTFAGTSGAWGFTDGTGAAATFSQVAGVAFDPAGNLFVADESVSIIRKITPAGVVTTFAGAGYQYGSADGTGAAARFSRPTGVATDSAGNVYVADSENHVIRKITPAAVVTTFAGTAGASGSNDGTGAAARFYHPSAIAADSLGNLYVADGYNAIIRKITPAQVVTTLAGTAGLGGSTDGNGAAARFSFVAGIAVDRTGTLYVADAGNDTIRRIAANGDVTTLAGTAQVAGAADGTGADARFDYPLGIAVDAAGNVFVSDAWNHTIRRITPAGVTTTWLGKPSLRGSTDGTGTAARFYHPYGMTADRAGNLIVGGDYDYSVRKVTPAGLVTTVAGTHQFGSANGPAATATFGSTWGVAVDGANNIYVVDRDHSTVRRISAAGDVTTFAGSGTTGSNDGTGKAASFNLPSAVALDSAGNLFVSDSQNHTIRKVTPAGVVTTFAGTAGAIGFADGTGAAARFYYPQGIVIDGADNLYVAEAGYNTIRKITPAAVVTTFAGSKLTGSADGTGTAASFHSPIGLALSAAGNLYVTDAGNNLIRKITPAGVVTTVVGTASVASFVPGNLPGVIAQPTGIAIVGSTLYFATNNGIARVTNVP